MTRVANGEKEGSIIPGRSLLLLVCLTLTLVWGVTRASTWIAASTGEVIYMPASDAD